MTDAPPATSAEELGRVLQESPFAGIYRFKLESFARGECVLTVPFSPAFERPGDIVAGPVYMAAADVAMWLAILTLLGNNAQAVTTGLNTNFLASAKKQDVRCRARVLKLGKTLIQGLAECTDTSGRLLTHHAITYLRTDA